MSDDVHGFWARAIADLDARREKRRQRTERLRRIGRALATGGLSLIFERKCGG